MLRTVMFRTGMHLRYIFIVKDERPHPPNRRPSRPQRRLRLLPAAHLAEIYAAWIDGMSRIIQTLNPQYARRYSRFLEHLSNDFDVRFIKDEASALLWLREQLKTPRLPDLRRHKTLDADGRLTRQYDHLKRALAPVFRKRLSLEERRAAAAPIVAHATGHQRQPRDLPESSTLAAFCYRVLNTDAVTVSRARRRFATAMASEALRRIDNLGLLAEHLDEFSPPSKRREVRRRSIPLRKRILALRTTLSASSRRPQK